MMRAKRLFFLGHRVRRVVIREKLEQADLSDTPLDPEDKSSSDGEGLLVVEIEEHHFLELGESRASIMDISIPVRLFYGSKRER